MLKGDINELILPNGRGRNNLSAFTMSTMHLILNHNPEPGCTES